MSKVIVVFGATGAQGGSVARALLCDPQYKVRAVTRDPNSPAAGALAAQGAEVVCAEYGNKESLARALEGAYGCFVVTKSQFGVPNFEEIEVKQGENIADVCAVLRVQHVVFSLKPHVRKVIGIVSRHCDAKARIEDYMNELNLPLTSVIVPFTFENFLGTFKPRTVDFQRTRLEIPMGEIPLDAMSVDQLGDCVKTIFNNPSVYISKTLALSADKLTIREYAATLSRYSRPYIVRDAQLTTDDFRRIEREAAEDYGNMFEFFQRVDQRHNMRVTKALNPQIKTFDEWVRENVARIQSALR
ncbi:nmrA-like family domain-containing protein 1 [Ptychodera flava]|uniref:nmrA-like family domain-containing protein 1 n=1 Tax=Ptychodera flava TaxID=63121 RepID=UPI00396A99C8